MQRLFFIKPSLLTFSTTFGAVFLLCAVSTLWAGEADLTWTPPLYNVDGSALVDLNGYRVHFGRISSAGETDSSRFRYEMTLPAGGNVIPAETPSLTVTGLQENVEYFFAVSAIDFHGNESTYSSEVSAIIPVVPPPSADTSPPTTPTGLVATEVTPQTITLQWQVATDNIAVTGYRVFRDGVALGTVVTTSMQVTGLQAQTAYALTVSAMDAAGNASVPSAPLHVTTLAAEDTTPPSPPPVLSNTDLAATSVTLHWSAATDNVAVVGYWLYVDGVFRLDTAATQQTLTALTPSTTYTMAVSAVDAAGNESPQRATLTLTTLATPALPPLDTSPAPVHDRLLVEFGEVTLDHTWTSVTLEQLFVSPIVVATPVSQNDPAPVVIRLRNVHATGFEIRLQEWNGDGTHAPETASYVVLERGVYTLPDGTRVEAEQADTAMTTEANVVSLAHTFSQPPIVLTSVVSVQEADAVTTRVQQITPQSFALRLQEEEDHTQTHSLERIAYVVWQAGSGTVDGVQFEAGRTEAVVQHDWHPLVFQSAFARVPALLAAMQTTNDPDPATLRWQHKEQLGVDIRVEEELSADGETAHGIESVGYLLLARTNPEVDAPPSLHIVTPTDNSAVAGQVLVQIAATDDRDAPRTLTVDVSIDQKDWQTTNYNDATGLYELLWEATAASRGGHTIDALAIDTAENIAHATPVTVNIPGLSLHVGDLAGTSTKNRNSWTGAVTITVHDAVHQPVADATVQGNWQGGYTGSVSCITDGAGQCRVRTGSIQRKRGSATLTISAVSHATYEYHPVDSHDVNDDSDGSTITVFKP